MRHRPEGTKEANASRYNISPPRTQAQKQQYVRLHRHRSLSNAPHRNHLVRDLMRAEMRARSELALEVIKRAFHEVRVAPTALMMPQPA